MLLIEEEFFIRRLEEDFRPKTNYLPQAWLPAVSGFISEQLRYITAQTLALEAKDEEGEALEGLAELDFSEILKRYERFHDDTSYWKAKLNDAKADHKACGRNLLKAWREEYEANRRRHQDELLAILRRQAEEALKEYLEALKQLSECRALMSLGFGLEPGDFNAGDVNEVLRLAHAAKQIPRLDDLCDLLGRLTDEEKRIEYRTIREKVGYTVKVPDISSKEEIIGVGFGRAIEDLLPQELALLADPEAEILFDLKFVENRLMCFEKIGYMGEGRVREEERTIAEEKKDQKGPMILCVDTSGSMAGVPETTAKVMVLYLSRRARRQGRDAYLINFGVDYRTKCLSGKWSVSEALDFLGSSWGCGTDASGAIAHAVKMLHEEKTWEKADFLLISDMRVPPLPSELTKEIAEVKKSGNRFYGVVVGGASVQNDPYLDGVFDAVYDMHNIFELK